MEISEHQEAYDNILRRLSTSRVPQDCAGRAVDDIRTHIQAYLKDRAYVERVNAAAAHLDPWWRETTKRLEDLRGHLDTNPLRAQSSEFADAIAAHVRTFARAADDFQFWMKETRDPRRSAGRPVDWPRGDLELRVALTLADVGIETNLKRDNVGAYALEQVYAIAGIEGGPQKKIRALLEHYSTEINKRLAAHNLLTAHVLP